MTAKPAVVGAFVLGAAALAVVAVLMFASLRLFAPTIRAVAFFPGSVAGLSIGAPVTFRGVRVGSVARVRLELDMRDRTAEIPVVLDLDPAAVAVANSDKGKASGLESLIRAGLRAQLTPQSVVTGQLQVELDLQPNVPGTLVGRGEPGMPEIPTIPSVLQNLREQVEELHLRELVDRASAAAASVTKLADQLNTRIGPIADDLGQTVSTARDTMQAARATIEQVRNDSDRVLTDFDKLAVESRTQLGARGSEVSQVLGETNRTLRQVQTLIGSINDMTAPRGEARLNFEAALRDLAAASASLRGLAHDVEQDPSMLIMGRRSR